MKSMLIVAAAAALTGAGAVSAQEDLAKSSGCLNCHATDTKKVGPAFKDVAKKYKGKADAEATLYKHLTTHPTVKVDGKEEKHESLKTKDDADVKNVIAYILSR